MHANKARGVLIAFLAMIVACSNAGGPVKDRRLQVVATVFPLYDFARAIGGEKVFVTMLIPPGTDARDFELTEDDIEAAGKADIFMFASFEMEQWAEVRIAPWRRSRTWSAFAWVGVVVERFTLPGQKGCGGSVPVNRNPSLNLRQIRHAPWPAIPCAAEGVSERML